MPSREFTSAEAGSFERVVDRQVSIVVPVHSAGGRKSWRTFPDAGTRNRIIGPGQHASPVLCHESHR